jgi:hypothetical protein
MNEFEDGIYFDPTISENENGSLISSTVIGKAGGNLAEIEHLRMTADKAIPELTPIIKMGESILSTPGNITVFSGEAKSGKTAALGSIMAGAIAKDKYDGFNGLTIAPNTNSLAVIHIETEQSEAKHKENHVTILRRTGLESTPDHFLSYNVRRMPITEYKEIVKKACKGGLEKFKGVHLIVIDGIGDFIPDVNFSDEANEIVHWLEMISIEYGAPIIVVVHVNPKSEKERGHLGSQLQRKCESLLIIKRDGDICTIEPKLLRNAGMGETQVINFIYDKTKRYHVSCGIGLVGSILSKDLKRIEKLQKVAAIVFADQKSMKYGEAELAIMKVTKEGITATKNIFKEMRAQEMIRQEEDKRWRLNTDPA